MLNKKKVRQGKAEIRAQLGYMQQTALLAGRPDSAPLLPNQPWKRRDGSFFNQAKQNLLTCSYNAKEGPGWLGIFLIKRL